MCSLLQYLNQLDYVGMWGKTPQGLDFSETVDLVERVEVVFHAFDSYEFAGFDALGFEDFAESAFAFLGYQTVL